MRKEVLNLLLRIFVLLSRFSLLFMLAFFLNPEEIGAYGLLAVAVAYTMFFVGLDFYTFSNRDMVSSKKLLWKSKLYSQGALYLLMYSVTILFTIPLFELNLLPWWSIGWFLSLLITEHLSFELSRFLIVSERQLTSTLLLFIRQAVWVPLLLILMWWFPIYRSVETVLTFWLIGSLTSIFVGLFGLKSFLLGPGPFRINLEWIRKGLRVALPFFIASLSLRALFSIDRFIFEQLNGIELLGAYSLYLGISGSILSLVEASIFSFRYPAMINSAASNNWKEFFRNYKALLRNTIQVCGLLIIVISVISYWLFGLLPHSIYKENYLLFVSLIIGAVFYTYSMVPHYGLYSLKCDNVIVHAHVLSLIVFVVTVLISFQITPYWSVSISLIFSFLYMTIYKQKKLKDELKKRELIINSI